MKIETKRKIEKCIMPVYRILADAHWWLWDKYCNYFVHYYHINLPRIRCQHLTFSDFIYENELHSRKMLKVLAEKYPHRFCYSCLFGRLYEKYGENEPPCVAWEEAHEFYEKEKKNWILA